MTNASWLLTPAVPLNPGLVGIIGARGSGKTALAEVIAAGTNALSLHVNERSFVQRARTHLADATSHLAWESGDTTSNRLVDARLEYDYELPLARYLSQHFVDRLCSAESVTDELLEEIERVIFQAHSAEDLMGTTSFRELLELRISGVRAMRSSNEEVLSQITDQLTQERERKASLPTLQRQRAEKEALINRDKRDRVALIVKGGEERARQLDVVAAAAQIVRAEVERIRRRLLALGSLKDEVADHRSTKAPMRLRQLRNLCSDADLQLAQWGEFLLDFKGNVDRILAENVKAAEDRLKTIAGPAVGEPALPDGPPSNISLVPPGISLEAQTLTLLEKEALRLRRLIGIDDENIKAFNRLSDRISREEAMLAKLDREIETSKTADKRIVELLQSRRDVYASVFESIVKEEELANLYAPLKTRLEQEEGTVSKLSFSIRRVVDIAAWATNGESHLDLRKTGPFKGKGALFEAASTSLKSAWESGSSRDVTDAMADFRDRHEKALTEHAPVERTNVAAYREWASRVAGWLYSTGHISVSYSLKYEGADIEQLSPGTRGIVLLLLYLAIDRDDDRPLLIDQPEENLDPKSIFDELVSRFRRAKLRRQIIIVTHNANLIVNTDADQVIVASCGTHRPGQLPEITYQSGGIENPVIRARVCDILEGGAEAFRERARRLRVAL